MYTYVSLFPPIFHPTWSQSDRIISISVCWQRGLLDHVIFQLEKDSEWHRKQLRTKLKSCKLNQQQYEEVFIFEVPPLEAPDGPFTGNVSGAFEIGLVYHHTEKLLTHNWLIVLPFVLYNNTNVKKFTDIAQFDLGRVFPVGCPWIPE